LLYICIWKRSSKFFKDTVSRFYKKTWKLESISIQNFVCVDFLIAMVSLLFLLLLQKCLLCLWHSGLYFSCNLDNVKFLFVLNLTSWFIPRTEILVFCLVYSCLVCSVQFEIKHIIKYCERRNHACNVYVTQIVINAQIVYKKVLRFTLHFFRYFGRIKKLY